MGRIKTGVHSFMHSLCAKHKVCKSLGDIRKPQDKGTITSAGPVREEGAGYEEKKKIV